MNTTDKSLHEKIVDIMDNCPKEVSYNKYSYTEINKEQAAKEIEKLLLSEQLNLLNRIAIVVDDVRCLNYFENEITNRLNELK